MGRVTRYLPYLVVGPETGARRTVNLGQEDRGEKGMSHASLRTFFSGVFAERPHDRVLYLQLGKAVALRAPTYGRNLALYVSPPPLPLLDLPLTHATPSQIILI